MENNKNQQLKSYDVISVFIHSATALTLILAVILNRTSIGPNERAKLKSEALAYQAIQVEGLKIGKIDESIQKNRMPASEEDGGESVGRIGVDPWGKKYFYQHYGEKTLAIWSSGQNGVDETSNAIGQMMPSKPIAGGDDVLTLVMAPSSDKTPPSGL